MSTGQPVIADDAQSSADRTASAVDQGVYLMLLMFRLKLWTFLFWLLILPALFLNFFTMRSLDRRNPDTQSGPNVKLFSAADASEWKALTVTSATVEADSMEAIMKSRGTTSSWLEKCDSKEACKATFMESIFGLSDRMRAFMQLESRFAEFSCLDAERSDLICSYMFHVMSQGMDQAGATAPSVFKDVKFVKFFDRFETEVVKRERLKANISAPDSLCLRSAQSSGAFFDYFPRYFMAHIVIVAATMTLYFSVSTLASIDNLKENGFLQLMFNSGLSVAAYWTVVWLITAAEIVLIALLVILSYGIHCPGFYSTFGLVKSFFILCCFFAFFASLGLFLITLVGSYFFMLIIMIFLNVLLMTIVLMARIHMSTATRYSDGFSSGMAMLVFPPGNIVEYLLDTILPETPVYKRPKGYESYFLAIEILMPTVPSILTVLTIYLDFIVKNGNGLCLPYGYPFNSNFWNPHRQKPIEMVDTQPRRPNVEPANGIPTVITNEVFMRYPSSCPCGSKNLPVLKGVTFYQGQITALIGHNGAGKTTLIRVLMGEEIPTSGAAIINGHRVTDPYQRLALRGSVSICKQVDVLSNYLTVMESMKLTLVSKGFSVDSQVNKVLEMLKKLGLAGKEDVQAMDLSGGQMRKVCSIICLLGNPKLVILDEPTSGLDPVSRRNLWQILQDHKAGRSIILCTQFMDEADILADRKMFLSAGKLICAGSSLFLKHAFGCCVGINVSLKSEGFESDLMKTLKKVKLVGKLQTELLLQVASDKPHILANAVEALEAHPEWVEAFGVSQAQLDDLFMRLKYIDMDNIEMTFRSKKLRKKGRKEKASAYLTPIDFGELGNPESKKNIRTSVLRQFCTLLVMNFRRQVKKKLTFCFRLLFPLILIFLTWFMTETEKVSDTSKDGANSETKLTVRTSVTDFGKIVQFGICIFDLNGEGQLDSVTEECNKMFGITHLQPDYVKAVPKSPGTSIAAFLMQPETMKTIRTLCRFSFCFIVHSSSWSKNDKNSNRVVHIGQYTNPMDVVVPNENAISIGHMITIYLMFAKHFAALPRTFRHSNLTVNAASTVNTLEGFSFNTCYELLIFITAFSILPITYLNDPIEDKDCNVRKHLSSMGMKSFAYWLNTFIMHWLHYLLYFFLSAMVFTSWYRYQSYFFLVNIVLPVLFLGTISCQLSVYAVSAVMKKSNAVVMVSMFFFALFLGILAIYLQDYYTVSMIFACFLPPLAPVLYMVISVKLMVYGMLFFDTIDADAVPNLAYYHSTNKVANTAFFAMPAHILILIGFLIAAENPGCLRRLLPKSTAKIDGSNGIKDVGVIAEADRIKKMVRNTVNMLEVRDLQKIYPNGVHAVRGTTFGSICGEIIGLLGPNGAGKTTSMSIIVGEEASSSGTSEIHFSGTWMSGMEGALCGAIGYCPQHNPLFNAISVIDHLRFYASIRGIPEELATKQIDGLIDGLGLKPHQEKASSQLSGGNKRRLCLAIALLGNPSLVVIDEASTGVDPENKRFIWSAIRGMANKQRSVMITTHSMEEVEALCSRVGIMNKGVMIAFGTVQQLRSRHGEAYTLDILMKALAARKLTVKKRKLTKFVARQFNRSLLMESLPRCMQFFIPKESVPKFSAAIRLFIDRRRKLGIQCFTLYQMSLDQVFVKLVKECDEAG